MRCLAAMPPPGPAAPARLSLRPTAGKRPPRPFKNKLCSPLDGLPSENKHSSSARLPGTLAGAHAHASGAPLQPRLPRPATRPPPPPALACRRRGGHQIPLPTLRRGDPHSAPVRSAAAGAPEENAAEQANGVSGAGTSPAGERAGRGGRGGYKPPLRLPTTSKIPWGPKRQHPPPPPTTQRRALQRGGGGGERTPGERLRPRPARAPAPWSSGAPCRPPREAPPRAQLPRAAPARRPADPRAARTKRGEKSPQNEAADGGGNPNSRILRYAKRFGS